jgi:uncharacterized membrane protein
MRRHRHPANVAIHDRKATIDRNVDRFVNYFGSLAFIGWQTLIIIIWVILNITAVVRRWDPYPFILLNLVFSTQAAYAAPLILMAQNRASEHDRLRAEEDYRINNETLTELKTLRAEHAELRTKLTKPH